MPFNNIGTAYGADMPKKPKEQQPKAKPMTPVDRRLDSKKKDIPLDKSATDKFVNHFFD